MTRDYPRRATSSACAKSAQMSSMCSMPTLTRIISCVTPLAVCSVSVSCLCVVLAGWMTRVLASPTLASWLARRTASMNLIPGPRPPLTPNVSTAPCESFRKYSLARAWYGCAASPGYDTQVTMGCCSRNLAHARVLLQWRSIRRESVSSPSRKLKDPKGDWHMPTSRSPSTRQRIMKATLTPSTPVGPKVSQNLSPWYPGDGSVKMGCLPLFQSMVPPSTMTPPTVVPCPPIHLVADSTTMSAPCFSGAHTYPHAPKVLSQMMGMPCRSATALSALKSGTENLGLPMVSTYSALVLLSMSASKLSGSSSLANLTLMPRRGRVTLNWLKVPPYSDGVDTRLSPWQQMVVMARNCADMPEETATAPTPPSSAATRFSNTSLVGFMMRL
mmetsp:Transcript_13807/g.33267  ORF Transcript_13807/g.33267 Transcript_13807/m.33267 type:complete len:387 (-) Transcript_13807:250-1410(-)